MKLREAIDHAREVSLRGCSECNKEHGQLADWLEELEKLREVLGDAYDLDRLRELLNVCSGKTPNQVKEIFEEWSHYLEFVGKMNAIEDELDSIYGDGNLDYDRLRELVVADKDGRCVVLPDRKHTDEDGKNALKSAMNTCYYRNNPVTRYIADAVAEKLTREAALAKEADHD